VALVDKHRASERTRSEHRYGPTFVVVITTPSAVVVGCAGEHVGAGA